METENSLKQLATALAKAQGMIKSADVSGNNTHFKNRYSTLADVWDAIREPLSSNGLSIVQLPEQLGERLMVRTLLMHSSGEMIIGLCPVIAGDRPTMQSIGSGITYAKRYALQAMIGVCGAQDAEEDDGEKTMARSPKEPYEDEIPNFKPSNPGKFITEPQVGRLWKIKTDAKVSDEDYRIILASYNLESTKHITMGIYQEICNKVEHFQKQCAAKE